MVIIKNTSHKRIATVMLLYPLCVMGQSSFAHWLKKCWMALDAHSEAPANPCKFIWCYAELSTTVQDLGFGHAVPSALLELHLNYNTKGKTSQPKWNLIETTDRCTFEITAFQNKQPVMHMDRHTTLQTTKYSLSTWRKSCLSAGSRRNLTH